MPETILLADADLVRRTDWEALLREQGYAVVSMASGEALLDSCPLVSPDLVVIVGSLPDMRSPEISRRLNAEPSTRLTPVFSIPGFSDASESLHGNDSSPQMLLNTYLSRWEVLTRMHSLLHIRSYIDDQSVASIVSLARSIEGRDPYTNGHCERLTALVGKFGKSLDLSEGDLEALSIGASIHDIGKIMLPDAILLNPGWLTLEESRLMEQHPLQGERICAPLNSLRDVLPIIRHHHERADGSGYPDGLRRSLIPVTAQVLQIADIFDALTTERPYRSGVTAPRALTILSEEADRGLLDARLVDRFSALLISQPLSYAFPYLGRNQTSRLA